MVIRRGVVEEYLNRDFDDFRWMKKLSRDDILRELNALKVKPQFKTELWQHQLVCFYIGICQPHFLFLLDMGLGKTAILLALIEQAKRERRLEGALVTVPRVINMDSWIDDTRKHSNLEPWACNVKDTEEKWDRLAYPKGDLTLIDYHGLHLALCKKEKYKGKMRLVRDDKRIKHVQKQYNWIGIDESHKLSSHNNLWFGIMNQLTKSAEFCYGSTGTLFGKDVEDLWAQFKLVDRGETFGENLGPFREGLFIAKMNPFQKGPSYSFDPKKKEQLTKMLQHRSIRYDEDEVLDLPKRVARTVRVEMGVEQKEHYLRALQGLINSGGKLSEMDAQWIRMRQIISGYLAWNDDYGKHVLPFKHNPKLDALQNLIEEMGDSKIVVPYVYTETGRLIVERVKAMGYGYEWFYGGTKDKSASRRRFMEDPGCKVMVMQEAAGGTGNDGLQKVSRYMVMYETPTEPKGRQQVIKRIHRPGQTERVFIYDLAMDRSTDKGILADLAEGIDFYDRVVNGKGDKNIYLT